MTGFLHPTSRSRPGALQPGTVERHARSILTELTLPKTEDDHRESAVLSGLASCRPVIQTAVAVASQAGVVIATWIR